MNINKAFQLAIEHYQSGNLQQAEHICRYLSQIQPDNIHVLNLFGVILYQRGGRFCLDN
jgi:Flp pilus assembly protein TadD